jgi:hypothetical protein
MALSNHKVMMQSELSHISNVVWETVKRIAPLLEVEKKINFDKENFYTPPPMMNKLKKGSIKASIEDD